MENFVTGLLNLIGKNPDQLQLKALRRKVLWRILEFGIKRVDLYLKYLGLSLDQCIDDCQTQDAADLEEGLRKLRSMAVFPRDILSDSNAKPKFFSDCDALLRAIRAKQDTEFNQIIQGRASNDSISSSEPWSELQHYCGRLLSYRQAAETLVSASERWPELFERFNVITIKSSTRMPRPMPNCLISASDIISHMGLDERQVDHYLQRAHKLQPLGLDSYIRDIVAGRNFRPVVHSEVLVHNRLQRLNVPPNQLYWNGWAYIGSSKPTCRLCSYYFKRHDFAVRTSHNNLYHSWRLPDLPKEATEADIRTRREEWEHLMELARHDVARMMDTNQPMGQKHDTLTYSAGNLSQSSEMASIISWMNRMCGQSTSPQTTSSPTPSYQSPVADDESVKTGNNESDEEFANEKYDEGNESDTSNDDGESDENNGFGGAKVKRSRK